MSLNRCGQNWLIFSPSNVDQGTFFTATGFQAFKFEGSTFRSHSSVFRPAHCYTRKKVPASKVSPFDINFDPRSKERKRNKGESE